MSEHSQKTATVVPFRPGHESDDLTSCPPFDRAMAIAGRVQDARESELRHIGRCHDCAPRVQQFQVHLGTTPQMRLEAALRDASGPRTARWSLADPGSSAFETYATALYTAFAPSWRDPLAQHRLSWRATHLFARAIVFAVGLLPLRVQARLFDVCSNALIAGAAGYATVPHSVDALWPLLECVQEAGRTVATQRQLRPRYVRLWTDLIDESPLTVRTVMHWGLWELAFRGGDVGKIAIAALRRALHGTHAHEIAPVAALVFRMHPKIARRFDPGTVSELSDSPELVWMVERAAAIKKKMTDIFAAGEPRRASGELSRLLDNVFDKPSLRGQLIGTIVVRAGIVQALRALGPAAAREKDVAKIIAHGLFRDDTDRSRRSLYAELRVYDALRHRDPDGWSENLLRLLSRVPDYERHGVVRTVVAAYEDATDDTYDPRPPRFVRARNGWEFTTPRARPFDRFCHGLASLANESDDFAAHLEWANGRFDSGRAAALGH